MKMPQTRQQTNSTHDMKPHRTERTESAHPVRRTVCERLSQRLEAVWERERCANQAHRDLLEEAKLRQARLALFGSAPQ